MLRFPYGGDDFLRWNLIPLGGIFSNLDGLKRKKSNLLDRSSCRPSTNNYSYAKVSLTVNREACLAGSALDIVPMIRIPISQENIPFRL